MKKPKLVIDYASPDGNVYRVIVLCAQAMEKAGCSKKEVRDFKQLAPMQGTYDNVIKFCQRYVDLTLKR